MKRATDWVVLVVVVAALLLATGIVDETWLLLGALGAVADGGSDTLRRGVDAMLHGDWKTLAGLGGPLLAVYALRSLLYLAAAVLVAAWAVPRLVRAFESLRRLDSLELVVPQADLSAADTQASVVRALRSRAARKRVESYAFLAGALASLAIAVGFVTRETPWTRPEALEYGVTSPSDAMTQAQQLLDEARREAEERRDQARSADEEFVDIVRDQLVLLDGSERPEHIAARERVLIALLSRPARPEAPTAERATDVAKEYIGFARAQLDVANRQAELEALRGTSVEVVAKLAAVVLVLALARVLVRLYQRGLALSVQYEAIADAVQVGSFEPGTGPAALRTLFTPADAGGEADPKLPKSLVHALEQLVAALRPTREGR